MNITRILKKQIEIIKLDNDSLKILKKKTKDIVFLLEKEINRNKIKADVFIGGSFAKDTLLKRKNYDIDIFVRFDWRIEDISGKLQKIADKVSKLKNLKLEILHGSRDYFRIRYGDIIFEIIPIYKIKKPRESRNVTDLSYFHVNYIKKKLRGNKLAREILLAKSFCQAQGVYGAESYINGFSGYGLECLIINYRSFLKMLKELVKVKERIILDPEKHYKNKNDVLFSLNEARLQSPIVLVDPTWKERNVLAALSKESFQKFQEKATEFLRKPSLSFFDVKERNIDRMKGIAHSKKAELVHLEIMTDGQAGDIAGTKMKKFSKFLEKEIWKYFNVLDREFFYLEGQKAQFYLVVKPKEKILIYGPLASMTKHAKAFKEKHKKVFEKSGRLYSEIKVDFSCKEFLEKFDRDNKTKISEMGISEMGVETKDLNK